MRERLKDKNRLEYRHAPLRHQIDNLLHNINWEEWENQNNV